MAPAASNQLYFGDNLDILREYIADASIDLIYLDPPFNSQANYNVLFRSPTGDSQAQIEAFEDTWHWGDMAERAFDEVVYSGNSDAAEMLRALRPFLKENDMMAYLTMMSIRLIELHRVLKPTGSLYLHCDPTASHYLKLVMDAIFEARNFRNEISWQRTTAKSDYTQGATHFPRIRDTLLFYRKDVRVKGIYHQLFLPHLDEYVRNKYRYSDPDGRRYRLGDLTGPGGAAKGNPFYEVMGISRYWRYSKEKMEQLITEGRVIQTRPGAVPQYKRYLDEMPGVPMGDSWDDIRPINSMAQERLGYPTQKPEALLERIIQASTDPEHIVLDPFCGCGTAIHAAQKLGRQWIGIDITHLAITLIEKRLDDAFPGIQYVVHGTPKDLAGAHELATRDKYQFQWWAVSLVNAVPYGGKKKGADSGIDGIIYFKPDGKKTEKAIVSVKGGGNVSVPMIRDLGHVVDREHAQIGVFVTLAPPTGPMSVEATKAGFYITPYHGKIAKIQILTIAELFTGKKPIVPFIDPSTFRRARPEDTTDQAQLFA